MSDLFESLRERMRTNLRDKGWQEDTTNKSANYWWTPDGRELLLEEEAILREERSGHEKGRG